MLASVGALAAVVGGLAVANARHSESDDRPESAAAGTPSGSPGDARAAAAARAACDDAAVLGVPAAYVSTWGPILRAYADSVDSACLPVAAVARRSSQVAAGRLDGLDGWIPEDASWVDALPSPASARVRGEPVVVASSPILLAMPPQMAAAASRDGTVSPGWLRDMITVKRTWADAGRKQWGQLRLALPDPDESATGAIAFAALASVATNGKVPQTVDYAAPTSEQMALIRLEHRVAATADDDLAVLEALGPLDADVSATDPRGPGMWVTTEAVLLSTPDPAARVGVYLGKGAVSVQMPLVIWATAKAPVLAGLGSYLTTAEGRAALTDAGLRAGAARPATADLDQGGIITASGGAVPVATPRQAVLATRAAFGLMHIRLSSLVLLDASGSMRQTFPGTSVRKIDLVIALAKQTLDVASPQARSGVLTFQSDQRNRKKIVLGATLAPNGSDDHGSVHAARVYAAVTGVNVGGGTPLYDAIEAGYRLTVERYDPAYVNQLVVLTDGDNRDTVDGISRATLMKRLAGLRDQAKPIKVIVIGYGPDADMATLESLAQATGGKAVGIASLDDVADATREALFTP